MSRFDLYPTSDGKSYLLDLQSEIMHMPSTRMVAPVVPMPDAPPHIGQLHPTIQLGEEEFVMVTHLLGAVPKMALKPAITNLSKQADQFTRALDLLFQGY